MKNIKRFSMLLLLWSIFVFAQVQAQSFTLQEGVTIKLADKERAKELLTTKDEYTAVLSKFDLASKTKGKGSTVNDYLKAASEQALEWSEKETAMFGEIVESISAKIKEQNLKLNFPSVIEVVKTTMLEEDGAAAYTRGNYIVMGEEFLGRQQKAVEPVFIHELFHILSRNDRAARDRVYNIIGFKKTNEVPYPDNLKDYRISNPDAPLNNYYLTVTKEGKPVDVMLILYAEKPYEGGSFFQYLRMGLLAVEGEQGSKKPLYKDGNPVIYKTEEVENFFEQIGTNTGYIIHAEEVSADHFSFLLNKVKDLPMPELVEKMKLELQK
jgi:urease gamma subunit